MKKIYLPIIAAFVAGGMYITSGNSIPEKPYEQLGDIATIGADEEAGGRYGYELQLLKDPATGKIPDHIRAKELAFAASLPTDAYLAAGRTSAAQNWVSRGPWNVGGRTRALAIDVTNENILIAGSCSGGMWRSTDFGASWTQTTNNIQDKSVSCVAQDTRRGHRNTWYYGAGEAYGASAGATGAYYLGNGVYKSVDSGKTWSVLPSTTTAKLGVYDVWADLVWNIAIDPSDTVRDVVYAAASGAVYKTVDGGTTWTLAVGTGGAYFSDVAVTSTGVVYATLSDGGGQRGIFRSPDGVTFTNITPAGFPLNYNRVKIGISPADENQVYFLGNTPGYGMPDTNYVGTIEWNSLWKYKYVSGDGKDAGGQWHNLSDNLPSTGGPFDKFMSQGSYDLVVKIKPTDTNAVFIGGTNLYRSTSGFLDNAHTTYIGGYKEGATLPVVDLYLNHHPDQHDVVFVPSNPRKMLSANDGGIWYTNDNTAREMIWSSKNNGYLTTMFYSCAIDHATTNDIIVGGAQDNGSWFTNSANPLAPWVTPRGGDGSFCSIADYGKAYYLSIQNGKMMKGKLNNSGVVDSFARIDPIGGKGYMFINPYTLDPNNNDIMYLAGGKFVWRNHNLAGIPYRNNWDSISTNWTRFPDSTFANGATVTALAVAKTPANRLYVGTSSKRVFKLDSANVGIPRFKEITSTTPAALFPNGANVSCIAVDPSDGNNIIVVFSNYGVYSLFNSTDGGANWKKIGGNLESSNKTGGGEGPSCRWASIIPTGNNSHVYLVGTSVGLFATNLLNDTFTVWTQQGANTIGSGVVGMIDYRSTDGLVVAATHSNGIYSAYIASTAGTPVAAETKHDFQFTNYPNPFSGSTTIQFNLDHPTKIMLQIHDQMGRLIHTITDEPGLPGTKNYTFSGADLPGGIYYCTLTAGDRRETRMMMIVK